MPQPRRSSSRSSGGSGSRRSSSTRSSKSSRSSSSSRSSGTSRSASARRSSGASRSSSSSRSSRSSGSSRSAASRKAAAKKGGQARARQQKARKRASQTASKTTAPAQRAARESGSESAGKAVRDFRQALAAGIVRPTNLVILSRQRIEEVMQDAAKRGRVTMDDAQSMADTLYKRARRETRDVVKDLEQLVGRGRSGVERRTDTARKRGESTAGRARKQVEDAAVKARSRAIKEADSAIAPLDRARRAVGVGPSFPILGYDELTAAQVQGRLGELTPAQLRKVRDYEKRNANRKSVLGPINQKLG